MTQSLRDALSLSSLRVEFSPWIRVVKEAKKEGHILRIRSTYIEMLSPSFLGSFPCVAPARIARERLSTFRELRTRR